MILLIFGFVIHAKIVYQNFYNTADRQFKIPDIHSGFTPQGVDYLPDEDQFLISGYAGDQTAKIYLIRSQAEIAGEFFSRKISILDTNGDNFINHAGGVCASEKYIFLAGCDGMCYILNRDILEDDTVNSSPIIGSFEAYNNADFCYIQNNRLYVGEYYNSLKYKTEKSHHMTTPSGDKNKAIITVFGLSETDTGALDPAADNQKFGVSDIPVAVFSITDAVQGMCITGDEIVLSSSALFSSSELYFYDYQKIYENQNDFFSLNGANIPLYYLDSGNLNKIIYIPPKSEGLIYYDNKISIVFESAANKYLLGKWIGGEYVYCFDVLETMNSLISDMP